MKTLSENLRCLLLTIAFFISRSCQQSQFTVSRFKMIAAENVMFSGFDMDFTSHNRRTCAIACSARSQCLSYSFQSSTGRCLIFDRRIFYGHQMSTASGFQHYWRMADNCPADVGFRVEAGNCVLVSGSRIGWQDALRWCNSKGGHLYVGETAEEMTALKTAVANMGSQNLDYRVGARYFSSDSRWIWITGAKVKPELWDNGIVGTDPNKECCETEVNKPNKLHADRCTQVDRYVCQIPLGYKSP